MSEGQPPSTNDSDPLQPDFFSLFLNQDFCFQSVTSVYMFAAYGFTHFILQLPLSTCVLCMGHQGWKQQRSSAGTSHSDFYTYHMAVMELLGVLGVIGSTINSVFNFPGLMFVSVLIGAFPWTAQMILPVLICVERYQAVVHPVTYMRLRRAGGLRVRNASIVLVWLLSFAGLGMMILIMKHCELSLIMACVMVLGLTTVCFCSLSVLCVLIRPRPGEVGGVRAQADESKCRAFRTIVIILGVLLFKFIGNLVCYMLISAPMVHSSVRCVVVAGQVWCNVPCSLVLPLLFLHRKGKIPGCRHIPESG